MESGFQRGTATLADCIILTYNMAVTITATTKEIELPKLPKTVTKDNELKLWLSLFNAKTEEELNQIEALEVPIMSQAIVAYRNITADEKFKELERLRSCARHNEASALGHARREGIKIGSAAEREKWQGVVADKEAAIADKNAAIAEQAALIAELRAQLAETK